MNLFRKKSDLIAKLTNLKKNNFRIGLVPTMGALHKGHISLVKRSIKENDYTIVSIFVNPIQFNDKKDLNLYPKNLTKDCILPENKDGKSVYHQIVLKHEKRDEIRKELTANEIGSAIYYETPIHQQPIYQSCKFHLDWFVSFNCNIIVNIIRHLHSPVVG